MKRIILVLLMVLTSLSFTGNLDKYESKRVFDKNMDILLTGDLDKYDNDPEMLRAIEWGKDPEVATENQYIWITVIAPIIRKAEIKKIIEYEVIDVVEKNDESVLKIKFKRQDIDASKKDIMLKIKASYNIDDFKKLSLQAEEDGQIEDMIMYISKRAAMYSEIRKMLKNKTTIEEMEIYMDKKNGLWDTKDESGTSIVSLIFKDMENFNDCLGEITGVKQD